MSDLLNIINKLISALKDADLVSSGKIELRYHIIDDLQNRICVLTKLCSIMCSDLSFRALSNGQNPVIGLLTPKGPIHICCSPQFWEDFRFITPDDAPPFAGNDYDFSAEATCSRLKSLTDYILESKSCPKDIAKMLNESQILLDSQKPASIHKGTTLQLPSFSAPQEDIAKNEVTKAISTIIKWCDKKGILPYKEIEIDNNTTEGLFNITLELICLFTALCPELSFASTKHFDKDDKMFNDDFIVGFYTPGGPVAFHFKEKYKDRFSHITWLERAPKYDGYNNSQLLDRINCLISFLSCCTVEQIIELLQSSATLHESQKPPQKEAYQLKKTP